MIDLKPEDLAGLEYVKPECLECGCFQDLPCGPCAATKGKCSACSDDDDGTRCMFARLEARGFLADASLAAHREALEQAKKLIRGWHGISNVSHPHEDRLWAIYDANAPEMKPINALLASPDPARGIAERLAAGEKMAVIVRDNSVWMGPDALRAMVAALAAYDKAVGRDA